MEISLNFVPGDPVSVGLNNINDINLFTVILEFLCWVYFSHLGARYCNL